MSRFAFWIVLTFTVALLGGGYFLIKDFGKAKFQEGFAVCEKVGAALATEAARQLKDEMEKLYTPTTIDRMLLDAGWLHEDDRR